jgi:L-threonylcarbamoyladenylate synthase
MQTQVLSIDQPTAQATALAMLRAEQIIAAPTDTVYGLMARFDSAVAIEKLYEAKDRPPERAIPVLIGDLAQLEQLTPIPISPVAQTLIEQFWPGPLTLVLPALTTLLPVLTAGQPTVAVRMPAHAALRTLIQQAGPLAATSANRSGAPDTITATEVLAQLDGRIPLLLAGGASEKDAPRPAQPSTIVDLAQLDNGGPRILRPGPIAAAVRECLQLEFGYVC